MEDKTLNPMHVVYLLNSTDGNVELRVLADRIEHINGWVVSFWKDMIIGAMKEEYLRGFYLDSST